MKIFNYKIGIVGVLTCIMLIWLAWKSYQEINGLKYNSVKVEGYIDGFTFSGYRLMVWIRFKVNGKDHTSHDTAGPIIRKCYYTKGQPCIGQKCLVTYWKKNPNIIDYELLE
jgi:hypothetical protein